MFEITILEVSEPAGWAKLGAKMSIIINMKPEAQEELARMAAALGVQPETFAGTLLEELLEVRSATQALAQNRPPHKLADNEEFGERKIVTASLEGMRVVIEGQRCELQKFDFAASRRLPKDDLACPLPRAVANVWLSGWNSTDRFAAMNLLIGPQPDMPGRPSRRPRETQPFDPRL